MLHIAAMANEEQARYWGEEAGRIWVELEDRFDLVTGPFGDLALDAAAVSPGEAILDVGCGFGSTVIELARRTGPGGRVVGVDISAVMLDRARERVAAAGLGNVDLVLADAQTETLGTAAFDVVFSRFGVMFFADPVAAFTNLRRSLHGGGRLAFVCWQGPERNAWLVEPLRAVAGILELPPPPGPDDPSPLAFGDPARVRAVLGGAGFVDVDLAASPGTIRFGTAAESDRAAEIALQMGPGRVPYGRADAAAQARARDAVEGVIGPHRGPDGVVMPAACWVVTARTDGAG